MALKNAIQIENNFGVIDINPIDGGDIISIEFFPNNQSVESFEDGEFNAIFKFDSLINNEYTPVEILDKFKSTSFDDGGNFVDMLEIVKIAIEELNNKQ